MKAYMYIKTILLPYIGEKRKRLNLRANSLALVIFDKFTGQGTEMKLLEDNHIYVVMVLAITVQTDCSQWTSM